jgi:acetylornithine deacetylase
VPNSSSFIDLLQHLVGFDTTSHKSNLELIHFVRDYLNEYGIRSTLIENENKDKANLFASIGPDTLTGGVVLSGHTDVVPVVDQVWSSDPFTLTRLDDKLFGRGTCDMKGFIAVVLAAVPEMSTAPLKHPIHIALTHDEETTFDGITNLLPELVAMQLAPLAVIIGEPTEMRLVNAHKGQGHLATVVRGVEGHASLPHRGVNAIGYAARLIAALENIADAAKQRTSSVPGLDPPFTTVNVGRIDGGAQFNIIPGRCSFEWEFRSIPDASNRSIVDEFNEFAATLAEQMAAQNENAGISTRTLLEVPAMIPRTDSPAERLVRQLYDCGEPIGIAFGTEAPCYQQADMPVVVFGPGSIKQAHQPDEFVRIEQLDRYAEFLRNLIQHLTHS